MVACLIQISGYWIVKKKVEKMHVITLIMVLLFGGLTLALHKAIFIKWKATVVNWCFALGFLGSQFIGKKTLVERMMAKALDMPSSIWTRLNLSWVGFFILSGLANIIVAYKCSENTWVNFKLFGNLAMTLIFIIGQMFILKDYLIAPEETADTDQE